jgi:hypothetical protein
MITIEVKTQESNGKEAVLLYLSDKVAALLRKKRLVRFENNFKAGRK